MRIEQRDTISFENPAEAIPALGEKLRRFERQFGRKSSEFYASYRETPPTPDLDAEEWASTYELYLQFLGRIDDSLDAVTGGAFAEAPSASNIALALAA
jgi:hypothetical protein